MTKTAKVTPLMKARLAEAWQANQAKNESAKDEKRAKDSLEEEMVKAKIDKIAETIGNRLVVATIEEREEEFIDARTFKAMVSDDEFWSVVKVTKGDAESILGKADAKACLRRAMKPASLKIVGGK